MALNWFNLEGKVALVTGSGTGIWFAEDREQLLAASGADVACHDKGDEARATSEQIRAMGRRSIPLSADLSKRDAQDGLVASAVKEFGRIDILVNNAGMIRRAPAVDYSDEDWDLLLEVNLSAPFRLSRRVGKLMIEQGGGRIVNIASLLAFQGGIRPTPLPRGASRSSPRRWPTSGRRRTSTSTPSRPATSRPTTPPPCAPTKIAAVRSWNAFPPAAGARPTTSPAPRSSCARTPPATSPATSWPWTAAGWRASQIRSPLPTSPSGPLSRRVRAGRGLG